MQIIVLTGATTFRSNSSQKCYNILIIWSCSYRCYYIIVSQSCSYTCYSILVRQSCSCRCYYVLSRRFLQVLQHSSQTIVSLQVLRYSNQRVLTGATAFQSEDSYRSYIILLKQFLQVLQHSSQKIPTEITSFYSNSSYRCYSIVLRQKRSHICYSILVRLYIQVLQHCTTTEAFSYLLQHSSQIGHTGATTLYYDRSVLISATTFQSDWTYRCYNTVLRQKRSHICQSILVRLDIQVLQHCTKTEAFSYLLQHSSQIGHTGATTLYYDRSVLISATAFQSDWTYRCYNTVLRQKRSHICYSILVRLDIQVLQHCTTTEAFSYLLQHSSQIGHTGATTLYYDRSVLISATAFQSDWTYRCYNIVLRQKRSHICYSILVRLDIQVLQHCTKTEAFSYLLQHSSQIGHTGATTLY